MVATEVLYPRFSPSPQASAMQSDRLICHERTIPRNGTAKFGSLAIDFMDWGRVSHLVKPDTTRFVIGRHSLGLRWTHAEKPGRIAIPLDMEGYVLGADGKRIMDEDNPVVVYRPQNGAATRLGFFRTALGLDGSVLAGREIIDDPALFASHFFAWVKGRTASFPFAAKLNVGYDGFVRLPLGNESIPVTTDVILTQYEGRQIYVVPIRLAGRIYCLFFSLERQFLGDRIFDPAAMAFYHDDPARYPDRRFYMAEVGPDFTVKLDGTSLRVGSARRSAGEVLRVITDAAGKLQTVTSFVGRIPLVIQAGEGEPEEVGHTSSIERMRAEGKGVGQTVVKVYPKGKKNGQPQQGLGFMVGDTVKYFTSDDVEKFGIAAGQVVNYRHEGGVVTEFSVRRGQRVHLILNRLVDEDEETKLENSYRANVPADQLEGVRLLEGLQLVRRDAREASVSYGGKTKFRFPAPPFDFDPRPFSVAAYNGGKPLYFRDVRRSFQEDMRVARAIARKLSEKAERLPDDEDRERTERIVEAKKLEQKAQHQFLSTGDADLAARAYIDAFCMNPALWEPLEDAMALRRESIRLRLYIARRSVIRSQVHRLLGTSALSALVTMRDLLLSEEMDALVTAHMLEILAGVHAGEYPGKKGAASRLLGMLPLLFSRNDNMLRRNLLGALRTLYNHEPTRWIVSAVITQMPPSLREIRWRLVNYFGFRTEPYRNGLTAIRPRAEAAIARELCERPVVVNVGAEEAAQAEWRAACARFYTGEKDEIPAPLAVTAVKIHIKRTGKDVSEVPLFSSQTVGNQKIRLREKYAGKSVLRRPVRTQSGRKGMQLECGGKALGTWWWYERKTESRTLHGFVRKRFVREGSEELELRAWRRKARAYYSGTSRDRPAPIEATVLPDGEYASRIPLYAQDGSNHYLPLPAQLAREKVMLRTREEDGRRLLIVEYAGGEIARFGHQRETRGKRRSRFVPMEVNANPADTLPPYKLAAAYLYFSGRTSTPPVAMRMMVEPEGGVDHPRHGVIQLFEDQSIPLPPGLIGRNVELRFGATDKHRFVLISHCGARLCVYGWDSSQKRLIPLSVKKLQKSKLFRQFRGWGVETQRTVVEGRPVTLLDLRPNGIPVRITFTELIEEQLLCRLDPYGEDQVAVCLYRAGKPFRVYIWNPATQILEPAAAQPKDHHIEIVQARDSKRSPVSSFYQIADDSRHVVKLDPRARVKPLSTMNVQVTSIELYGKTIGMADLQDVLPNKTAMSVSAKFAGRVLDLKRARIGSVTRYIIRDKETKEVAREFYWDVHGGHLVRIMRPEEVQAPTKINSAA